MPINLDFDPEDTNIIYNAAHAFRESSSIDHIVDGVLRRKNITIWYGETGVKKTQTALNMAVHVSEGKPWLGHETSKCNVLVFDTENGQEELEHKIAEIVRGELGYESDDGKTFYDVDGNEVEVHVYYISIADINLLNYPELGVKTMIDRIQRVQAGLFLVDGFDGLMVGHSDSEQANVTAVLYYLRQVIEATGATPLILHNTNRRGGFRGSAAIPQGAFHMVRITSGETSPIVHLTDEKLRRGKKSRMSCKCHWSKDEYEDDVFYMTVADPGEIDIDLSCTPLEQCVLTYLAKSPGRKAWLSDVKAYAKSNNFSEGSASNALRSLEKRLFTEKMKTGRKVQYVITSEGLEFTGLDSEENDE